VENSIGCRRLQGRVYVLTIDYHIVGSYWLHDYIQVVLGRCCDSAAPGPNPGLPQPRAQSCQFLGGLLLGKAQFHGLASEGRQRDKRITKSLFILGGKIY
jgi:hypothetical protein